SRCQGSPHVALDPAAMNARRFPPPWSAEAQEPCFVVRDRDGQQLAYVYFEDEPGAAKLLTRDEARRIAANIAKLPALLSLICRCTPCEARERLRPHGHRSFAAQNHVQVSAIEAMVLRKSGLTSLALNCGPQQIENVIIIKDQ